MKRSAGAFVVATCVVAALGAASAGERRAETSFVCSEALRTKTLCFRETDLSGRSFCNYAFEYPSRFSGTLRAPLADLGPTFRWLDAATTFSVSVGEVQYAGTLADSDYVPGRPVAHFVLIPADEDPDAVKPPPPLVKARVSWTRKRLVVSISARQAVINAWPGDESGPVETDRSVHAEFGAAQADVVVHLKGAVKARMFMHDEASSLVSGRLKGVGRSGN